MKKNYIYYKFFFYPFHVAIISSIHIITYIYHISTKNERITKLVKFLLPESTIFSQRRGLSFARKFRQFVNSHVFNSFLWKRAKASHVTKLIEQDYFMVLLGHVKIFNTPNSFAFLTTTLLLLMFSYPEFGPCFTPSASATPSLKSGTPPSA